jgi:thiamine biosynthesis lipoprotein ApbE
MSNKTVATALAFLFATAAHADDPPVTASVGLPMAPAFELESTAGVTRRLTNYTGRVVIIVYEDRDSNTQNDALKRELAEHARQGVLTRDVSLVAVANLSGYNFWPAKGYARDAVVEIARTQGYEIMIDWTGAMASSYHFRPARSHVMILSRTGRVLFRYEGPMSARLRTTFFETITAAIQAPR